MKSKYFFLVLLIMIPLCWGCSKSNTNPIAGSFLDEPSMISSSELDSSIGLFGAYNLTIAPDGRNVELTPMRLSSIGESYIVSGLNFFTVCPCPDCLNLFSFEFEPPYVKVTFDISHPFKPGNTNEPPTAMNRLDLDVFDLAMVIVPTQAEADTYSIGRAYTNVCGNQHGYTTELNSISGDAAACPYFLVIDDSETGSSTYNEFAMGKKNVLFDTWFANIGRFELYLTMGYGFSARRPNRLQPEYFNPEFNRKAAWRVDVIPPEGDDPPTVGNTWNSKDMITEYDVSVEVYDWQIGANVNSSLSHSTDVYSASEVEKVSVEIPGMTSLPAEVTSETGGTGTPNNPLLFTVPIANEFGLPFGEYTGLVKVLDERTPPAPFLDRDFIIDAGPTKSADITPPWLNFSPNRVFACGDYAYVASGTLGLHIFNISDPNNPFWVNWLDLPRTISDVKVFGDYAYIAGGHAGLYIANINPPESAYIVNTVDMYGSSHTVSVLGDYAYLATYYHGIKIIKINPPESAYVVSELKDGLYPEDICVDEEYAYVTSQGDLAIVDINPPESAHIYNTIDAQASSTGGIDVSGDYVYICSGNDKLRIFDVNPPEAVHLVDEVGFTWIGPDVHVVNGYAYVAGYLSGVHIVDIDPPETATRVKTIETIGGVRGVYMQNGYVYAANRDTGLNVIDIDPPESAFIAGTVETPGNCSGVHVEGSYAYVGNGAAQGMQIIDIDPPQFSHVVKTIGGVSTSNTTYISGGYAYVSDKNDGLQIIDIDPPESAYVVNTIATPGNPGDIYVTDGYVLAYTYENGFIIVDIDPPESGHIVKTIEMDCCVNDIDVVNGIAYLSHQYKGLTIVDISPPESAYIIKRLQTDAPIFGVDVYGDYAYLVTGLYGMRVVDINPPESAYVVRSFELPDDASIIEIADGYAYATCRSGLYTLNIDSIDSIHIVDFVDIPCHAGDVYLHGAYVYVSAGSGGLRIIKRYNPTGGLFNYTIPEYATYQTFKATVVEGL